MTPLHLLLLPVFLTVGGWLFTSCSNEIEGAPATAHETEEAAPAPETDMNLVTMLTAMQDAATRNIKRAATWVIPTTSYTTFYSYDDLYEDVTNYKSLTTKAVDVFFTTGTDASHHGRLHYSETQGWKFVLNDGSDPAEMDPGHYFVYGFVPRNAADNAELSLLDGSSDFADGAVLTINGMPSVMSDACVIIGAREGFSTGSAPDKTYYDGSYEDQAGGTADQYDDGIDTRTNRLIAGDFDFYYDNTETDGKLDNNMFLLFDHLCAALNINYKVDETYNTLRTIRLKKIHMKTANSGGITKKTNVTITLRKTDDGSSPIESIVYEPTLEESTGDDVFVSETDEGELMLPTSKAFVGHFMPAGTTTIILTSIYDIYDKKNNLVRKDCKATNIIRLDELISRFEATERGKKYTLNLTIQPTFLYVMSEPDLENPEMVVE